MNEYNKGLLVKVDENLYYHPHRFGWYKKVNGDFKPVDLDKTGKAFDLKLRSKWIRKYKKKIQEEYSKRL